MDNKLPEPYAEFRFEGEVVQMTEPEFFISVRNGVLCQCGGCLNCRATQYAKDNNHFLIHSLIKEPT